MQTSFSSCVALAFIFVALRSLGFAENAVEWTMIQKGDRPFKIPRISGRTPGAIARVNDAIDEATSGLKCGKGDYTQAIKDFSDEPYTVKLQVDYARDGIFSVYATMKYFCGTAYPTADATFSMTFDLLTGEKVGFEDLFIGYAANREKILRRIFSDQIQAARSGTDSNDSTCGDAFLPSRVMDTYEFDFTIVPNGLRVQPRWPHIIEACAERVEVPLEKMKDLLDMEGIAGRLMR